MLIVTFQYNNETLVCSNTNANVNSIKSLNLYTSIKRQNTKYIEKSLNSTNGWTLLFSNSSIHLNINKLSMNRYWAQLLLWYNLSYYSVVILIVVVDFRFSLIIRPLRRFVLKMIYIVLTGNMKLLRIFFKKMVNRTPKEEEYYLEMMIYEFKYYLKFKGNQVFENFFKDYFKTREFLFLFPLYLEGTLNSRQMYYLNERIYNNYIDRKGFARKVAKLKNDLNVAVSYINEMMPPYNQPYKQIVRNIGCNAWKQLKDYNFYPELGQFKINREKDSLQSIHQLLDDQKLNYLKVPAGWSDPNYEQKSVRKDYLLDIENKAERESSDKDRFKQIANNKKDKYIKLLKNSVDGLTAEIHQLKDQIRDYKDFKEYILKRLTIDEKKKLN